MIASLAMYDRPELVGANEALWTGIRAKLGFGPEKLYRSSDPWDVWQNADLLLSQTCGMPYRKHLHDHVQLVGTPDYGLPDCPPGYYNSVFVTRKDDETALETYTNRTFVYNEALSQSGWAAPQNHLAKFNRRFENLLKSGSHAQSAKAVADGRADIASLDGVTWRLLQRHEPFTANLQAICTTEPTPGLPLITGMKQNPTVLFDAARGAIDGLARSYKEALGLRGIIRIPPQDYLAIPTPPGP